MLRPYTRNITMSKKRAFQSFAAVLTLTLVVALIGLRPATSAHAAATKIMPLGDSITGTPGCWRSILWNRLQSSGYTNIDFVGSQTGQTCTLPYDEDNEGHGGYLAVDIANNNLLPAWLTAATPDIVMMHLGTNEVMNGPKTVAQILAAYTTMVGQMRANNPNMKILEAQIIPQYTATTQCTTCYQEVIDLNAAIPAWAAGLNTAQSPITVVDQWTGFDTTTDTNEGIHPNDAGNQKISDKWYPALVAALGGAPLPTASPTSTAITNTPTSTLTRTFTPVVTSTPTRTLTPAITSTLTRTSTVGITNTPTRTSTVGITNTPTRTSTIGVTNTPTRTNTPLPFTLTPTMTLTQPTSNTCSPVTSTITAPFTYDGAGTFCWQSSNLGTYINSWNLTSLTVDGVNETNLYVAAGSLPAKVNGYWYVSYTSAVAWGHFEAK